MKPTTREWVKMARWTSATLAILRRCAKRSWHSNIAVPCGLKRGVVWGLRNEQVMGRAVARRLGYYLSRRSSPIQPASRCNSPEGENKLF
jgi:hypothetical protein